MATSPAVYIMVGIMLSLLLSGLVIGLGIGYLQNHPEDERRYKLLMGVLLLLQLCHATMYAADTVTKYAVNFGSLEAALSIEHFIIVAIVCNAFIDGIVQGFYSYRIFVIFQRSIFIAVLMGLAVSASVGSILYIAVTQARAGNYITFIEQEGSLVGLVFILPAVCDVIITCLMLLGIYRSFSLGSNQGSRKILRRLCLLTIETNSITMVFQLITLLLYYTTRASYSIFSGSLPQLYIFTLIVWLASRKRSREKLHEDHYGQYVRRRQGSGSEMVTKPLAVHVETAQHVAVSSPKSDYPLQVRERQEGQV